MYIGVICNLVTAGMLPYSRPVIAIESESHQGKTWAHQSLGMMVGSTSLSCYNSGATDKTPTRAGTLSSGSAWSWKGMIMRRNACVPAKILKCVQQSHLQ